MAEQIRRQIVLRLIPSGQALLPELDLAAMFGVGRATIQQAMRLLVEDRMIEGRRGKGGGKLRARPRREPLGDGPAARAAWSGGGGRLEEALAYRRVVEPAAAMLAAEGRLRTDLGALRDTKRGGRAARTDVEFMQADTALHLALAEAAGNRFFREAIEPIRLELNDALIALLDSHVWRERSALEHDDGGDHEEQQEVHRK